MYRVLNRNEDQPWSDADADDLAHEVWRGENVHYIADYMCRRRDEVLAKARQLGLPLRALRR